MEPEDPIGALLDARRRESEEILRQATRTIRPSIVAASISGVCALVWFVIAMCRVPVPLWCYWIGPMPPLIAAGFTAFPRIGLNRKRLQRLFDELNDLAECDDLRVVNTLAGAATSRFMPAHARPALISGLIRLLPQLQPGDQALLGPYHRQQLGRALIQYTGPQHLELHLSILAALEAVGDAECIPHVRRLVQSLAAAPADDTRHAAALQCLAVLEARAIADDGSSTLMRPSAADTSPPGMLLRPAGSEPEMQPETLLRGGPATSSTQYDAARSVQRQSEAEAKAIRG